MTAYETIQAVYAKGEEDHGRDGLMIGLAVDLAIDNAGFAIDAIEIRNGNEAAYKEVLRHMHGVILCDEFTDAQRATIRAIIG